MAENRQAAIHVNEEYVKTRTWKDSTFYVVLRQFMKNKLAIAGLLVLLTLLVCAVAAPLICKYSPAAANPMESFQSPSAQHWFGTDKLGRDLFARIIYGGRYSLTIGIGASLIGAFFGIILGTIAGFFGGMVDNIIMRICDVIQNIPDVLICICISQALGGGLWPTLLALSIASIPGLVRILRASMLSVRKLEFVDAAKATNCSKLSIMFKHVLPNCLGPMIVAFSMECGEKILASASLSYIGLGVQEPAPEWGAMISFAKTYFSRYPFLIILPSIFVMLVVLSFNLIGDGLRDALDPKQRS